MSYKLKVKGLRSMSFTPSSTNDSLLTIMRRAGVVRSIPMQNCCQESQEGKVCGLCTCELQLSRKKYKKDEYASPQLPHRRLFFHPCRIYFPSSLDENLQKDADDDLTVITESDTLQEIRAKALSFSSSSAFSLSEEIKTLLGEKKEKVDQRNAIMMMADELLQKAKEWKGMTLTPVSADAFLKNFVCKTETASSETKKSSPNSSQPPSPSVINNVPLPAEDAALAAQGTCPISKKAYDLSPEKLRSELAQCCRQCGEYTPIPGIEQAISHYANKEVGKNTNTEESHCSSSSSSTEILIDAREPCERHSFTSFFILTYPFCRIRSLVGAAILAHALHSKKLTLVLPYYGQQLEKEIFATWQKYSTVLNRKIPKNLELEIVCSEGCQNDPVITHPSGIFCPSLQQPVVNSISSLFEQQTANEENNVVRVGIAAFSWLPSIFYRGGEHFQYYDGLFPTASEEVKEELNSLRRFIDGGVRFITFTYSPHGSSSQRTLIMEIPILMKLKSVVGILMKTMTADGSQETTKWEKVFVDGVPLLDTHQWLEDNKENCFGVCVKHCIVVGA